MYVLSTFTREICVCILPNAVLVLETAAHTHLLNQWFRLFWNASVDVIIGLIPFVGDFFDAYWHSYAKNTNLVRKHYGLPPLDALSAENADETAAADTPADDVAPAAGEDGKEEDENEEQKVEGDAVAAAGESK